MKQLSMKLIFLTANQSWAFVFGDHLLRMGSPGTILFQRREQAVEAARSVRLAVDKDGNVSSIEVDNAQGAA